MATITYNFSSSSIDDVSFFHAAGNQKGASVAGLTGGRWISTHDNGSDIQAALTAPDGEFPPSIDPLNTTTAGNQRDSDVAAINNGNAFVAWEHAVSGAGTTIRGRIVDPTGASPGADFAISQDHGTNEINPDVAPLETSNRAAVTWVSQGDLPANTIFVRVMSSLGNAISGDIQVAAGQANSDPHVAGLRGNFGDFVVTWSQKAGAFSDMWYQRFNSAGDKLGAAVNFDNNGAINEQPQIAALSNGRFAIAYVDNQYGGGGGKDITLKIFNSAGTLLSTTLANQGATAGDQSAPAITELSNGFIVVGWQNDAATPVDRSLDLALFDASGGFAGNLPGNFREDADGIALARLQGLTGGFVTHWTEFRPGQPDGDEIFGQTHQVVRNFTGDGARDVFYGDSLVDSMTGGSGDDALVGEGGNDVMNGDGGADFLFGGGFTAGGALAGGSGDDALNGGDGNDGLWGQDGVDTLAGGDGDDAIVGGGGGDILSGDAGTDFIFGGDFSAVDGQRLPDSGDDIIDGGDGNDALYGFDGDDVIRGRFGNDYVEGDAGADVINGGPGSDYLLGGADDDTINGGSGFDYLYGGSGADIFVFRASDSADWALDFSAAQGDRLRLEGFGYASFFDLPLVDLSSPGNPAVQFTFTSPGPGGIDQLTIFGVTLAQLNASNVLVA